MPEGNVEVARVLMAVNRLGPPEETIEVALSLTDPAVEFTSRLAALEGRNYVGHEGLRQYYADLADAFRVWRSEPTEIVELGHDAVLVENVWHGVGRDSGMEVELRSAIVFVFSGGLVVRCLSYPTRAEVLEAAGL